MQRKVLIFRPNLPPTVEIREVPEEETVSPVSPEAAQSAE